MQKSVDSIKPASIEDDGLLSYLESLSNILISQSHYLTDQISKVDEMFYGSTAVVKSTQKSDMY